MFCFVEDVCVYDSDATDDLDFINQEDREDSILFEDTEPTEDCNSKSVNTATIVIDTPEPKVNTVQLLRCVTFPRTAI